MKNLIVCCDGTWNTPKNLDRDLPAPTNVVKFHAAISNVTPKGTKQLKYYRAGVGTSGGRFEKLIGGGFGYGIDDDIKSPYKWLCDTYQDGDRIFLMGFSRGAYAVRSLAGLISRVGLYNLHDTELLEPDKWAIVYTAYDKYREIPNTSHIPTNVELNKDIQIQFLGAFDTVGALGVPSDFKILRIFKKRGKYLFHDTNLGLNVKTACQAVAIDERRKTFTPTLWTNAGKDQDVQQVWFPGVHADVGGGYAETGLSDIALHWMIEQSKGAGLDFQDRFVDQLKPDPSGLLHDSIKGVFKQLRTRPRSVPEIIEGKSIHESAVRRSAKPPILQSSYWRTQTLEPDQTAERHIKAKEIWNKTGLYLLKGQKYQLTATGEWVDLHTKSGPEGITMKAYHLAYAASSLVTLVNRLFSFTPKTDATGGIGTRRQDNMKWFALVGVIANGAGTSTSAIPINHQTFEIGAKVEIIPSQSGYLYCYANDVWLFYGNNRGKVRLCVKRLQ